MKRGKFITVEGIEGVGKSTNIEHLSAAVRQHGYSVVLTREPGGTPTAERIRQMLLEHGEEAVSDIAELLLFFAARSLHIENTILPALNAGQWVICDRFTDASRAYQGAGRGQDMTRIEALADWVQGELEPDLTVLLDAPAKVGMKRAKQRGAADRMESEQEEFYQRVRRGYLQLAEAHPKRFAVVDASLSMEKVRDQVVGTVDQLLGDN